MEWGERKTPLDKGRGISVTDVTVHRTADADKGFVHSSAKDHVKNRMDEDEGEYILADRVQRGPSVASTEGAERPRTPT